MPEPRHKLRSMGTPRRRTPFTLLLKQARMLLTARPKQPIRRSALRVMRPRKPEPALKRARTVLATAVMVFVVYLTRPLAHAIGASNPLAEAAVLVPIGAACYFAAHLGLWWLAGRPAGAESRLLKLLRRG